MASYITVTELKYYKDESILIGLCGTGNPNSRTLDETTIEAVIEDISGWITEELNGVYTIPSATPDTIKQICVAYVLEALFNRGEKRPSESDKTRFERAEKMMENIKEGKGLSASADSIGTVQHFDEVQLDPDTILTASFSD